MNKSINHWIMVDQYQRETQLTVQLYKHFSQMTTNPVNYK